MGLARQARDLWASHFESSSLFHCSLFQTHIFKNGEGLCWNRVMQVCWNWAWRSERKTRRALAGKPRLSLLKWKEKCFTFCSEVDPHPHIQPQTQIHGHTSSTTDRWCLSLKGIILFSTKHFLLNTHNSDWFLKRTAWPLSECIWVKWAE